jgi:hypothetical protein
MTRHQSMNQLAALVARLNNGFTLWHHEVPADLFDVPIFSCAEHYAGSRPDLLPMLYLTERDANTAAASVNDSQPLDSHYRAEVATTSLRRVLLGEA